MKKKASPALQENADSLLSITGSEKGVLLLHGPCSLDVSTYCKDVQPGHGRIFKCLREHEGDLSEPCRGHLDRMKKRMKGMGMAFMRDCRSDLRTHCKGKIGKGRNRIRACLESHKDQLSPACAGHFDD